MSLAVAEDAEGRILVAPRKSGVGVFDGKDWQVWTTENTGLGDDFVRHIRRAPTPREESASSDAGHVSEESASSDAGRLGRASAASEDAALLCATTHAGFSPVGGLSILRDGKWTTHTQSKDGLASYRVWDLCVDRGGNVWCATSRGVSRLGPDGRWRTFTTRNSGLAFDFVMGVAEAPDGAIWFATARGVSRFKP